MINPVLLGVLLLCVLCLFRMNIMLSMLISLFVAGLTAGLDLMTIKDLLLSGFTANADTALSYVLLGTLASGLAYTGIADALGRKVSQIVGDKAIVMLLVIAGIACFSQNLVPVHIAFIPIVIPPLLHLMNKLKIDRRAMACSLAFGVKAPYITIPFGFGLIFHGIIASNMTDNGMPVETSQIASVTWILGLCMFVGLLIALFVTYRKPREYEDIALDSAPADAGNGKLELKHWVTILALAVVVGLQVKFGSLSVAALGGIIVMVFGGAIKWDDVDDQFTGGIKIMGFIAFVMLIAGGFAEVMKATGGVESLVAAAVTIMGGNKLIAATIITAIGLLVTMGIGSSFSTIPILAVIYVPLCAQIGFTPSATILLIAAAAALGDAGSPASDTTLGPTSGLNADGQHNHIWDTCVPTFLHFNIPLMLGAIIFSQFI